MTSPVHKQCYRCERAICDLVDRDDVNGGGCGICPDCRLRLEASVTAGAWLREHTEACAEPDIPREMKEDKK